MDTLTTVDEDILFISDDPEPRRVAPRRPLVVFGVFLVGVGMPMAWVVTVAIGRVVQEFRLTTCKSQLRQLGVALQQYEDAYRQFPAPALVDRDGQKLLSWRVAVLPHLGYRSLYERFHLDEPWDSPHNRALISEMPAEFACPGGAGPGAGQTRYLVIVGPEMDAYSINTPFAATRGAGLHHMTDGTSNTILVLETDFPVPWTKPDDLQWTKGEPLPRLKSRHDGGSHALFADGSTRFIISAVDPNIFLGLLTINGGEVLSRG
jgi:prepilin-type processing-associated H-X9-DG protein